MNYKNYLYLLQFQDGRYFKFGISNNGNRIMKHFRTFEVNLQESLVISCKSKSSINALEVLIKNMFPEPDVLPDEYKGKDGATEIRDMEHWESCLKQVQTVSENLQIKFTPADELVKNLLPISGDKPKKQRTRETFNFREISKVLYNFRKIQGNVYKISKEPYHDGFLYRFYVNSPELENDDFSARIRYHNGFARLGCMSMEVSYKEQICIISFYFKKSDIDPEYPIILRLWTKAVLRIEEIFHEIIEEEAFQKEV